MMRSHAWMGYESVIRGRIRTHGPHRRLLSHGVTHRGHGHRRRGQGILLRHSGSHRLAHIMSQTHPLGQSHSVGHSVGREGRRWWRGHHALIHAVRHGRRHRLSHAMRHSGHGGLAHGRIIQGGGGAPTRLIHGGGGGRRVLSVRRVMRGRRRRIRRIVRIVGWRRRRSVVRIRQRMHGVTRLLRGITTDGLRREEMMDFITLGLCKPFSLSPKHRSLRKKREGKGSNNQKLTG